VAVPAGVVDGDDVGVVQGGRGPALAQEALDLARVVQDVAARHLEGDLALELRVEGAEDVAERPGADGGADLEARQAGRAVVAGRGVEGLVAPGAADRAA